MEYYIDIEVTLNIFMVWENAYNIMLSIKETKL